MIVPLLVTMLPVAQFMAAHDRKISHLLLFSLLLVMVIFSRTPAALAADRHCSKKAIRRVGSLVTILIVSVNLN